MNKLKLNHLPQEVINQIAAGEVIERPASVVKELVDNCIDAGATKISIKILNGGLDLIEISDNGVGIPVENLPDIFDAHTTSKISNIDDLNNLMSMGFRGEALSTITAVSKVSVISKYIESEIGNSIDIEAGVKSGLKKAARESGTVISVKDLFYNIPARKKYLKTAQTEYRKIYEILVNFFLEFPNIQFVLEKDGKLVEDILVVQNSKAGEITKERVALVVGKEFTEDMISVTYDGNGVNVQGYIAHPSSHKSRNVKNYIFVNNRAIKDRGIFRAVYEGYARFLPFGEKVPFVLNIKILPEIVDVNVHPRKEEVRFQNPYRIYSAIEDAVKHSLEKTLSFRSESVESSGSGSQTTNKFEDIRNRFNNKEGAPKEYVPRNITFAKDSSSVRDSLNFSKELLNNDDQISNKQVDLGINYINKPTESNTEQSLPINGYIRNVFQIFNKYIVLEFEDKRLWIMDQHAVAERINFEKLQKTHEKKDSQNLLVPTEISLSNEEKLFVLEFKEFFKELGFDISENKDGILINTVPVEFVESNFTDMFKEIFEITEDIEMLKKNFTKLRDDILATLSCHASIRKGQPLDRSEMINLYNELKLCKNPYSCPHGRPAIWRLTLEEIDKNFERTY